jgi:hypothetical protein
VLAREALAARVLGAGLAPAVTAPVAEGLDELLQHRPVGQHGAALAEGDLVGGIERERGQVAERADRAAVPARAQSVAAVLDQPQSVALAERRDGVEVERVSERVGDHHGPRAIAHRSLEPADIDVVLGQGDVHEHGHEPVLQDRVHRGGEAGGYRDHLVARTQPPVAQAGRGQRGEREQVRRRAGVHEQGVAMAGDGAELALEGGRLRPGGEPEVEARADELDDLLLAEHAPRAGNVRRGRVKRGGCVAVAGVLGDQLEDPSRTGVRGHLVGLSAPRTGDLSGPPVG